MRTFVLLMFALVAVIGPMPVAGGLLSEVVSSDLPTEERESAEADRSLLHTRRSRVCRNFTRLSFVLLRPRCCHNLPVPCRTGSGHRLPNGVMAPLLV